MNDGEIPESPEISQQAKNSLHLFHEAQQMAIDDNRADSIVKLEESLAAAEAESEPDLEWIAYIKGTLSYIQEDLIGIREQIPSAGENALVLSRLEKGLERRGSCDYKEDYSA